MADFNKCSKPNNDNEFVSGVVIFISFEKHLYNEIHSKTGFAVNMARAAEMVLTPSINQSPSVLLFLLLISHLHYTFYLLPTAPITLLTSFLLSYLFWISSLF